MEGLVLDKIAGDRQRRRSNFPLLLGGQARIGPARIGVGFVVTDVTYGFRVLHRLHPGQCHHPPGTITLFPVKWSAPAFALHRIPAHGQPKFRPFISSVGDEGQILRIGYKA